jgi:hypothetical protein
MMCVPYNVTFAVVKGACWIRWKRPSEVRLRAVFELFTLKTRKVCNCQKPLSDIVRVVI